MKRLLKYFGVALLAMIILAVLTIYLVYPAAYVNRVLRWRDADVYDYQKFPERELEISETPFEFTSDIDETRIQTEFQAAAAIEDFDAFLEQNRTQAFIVIHDDVILYEKYFNAARRDTIVTSFSIAKSFTSALIGIAISEGHIHSADDPITDYLPELAERDPAFAEITIRDLLMMSSGIQYAELPFVNGDDAKTYYYPDLRRLALEETQIAGTPGEYFLYNNYHPLLLGMILERATGISVAHYLQEKIWQPIGMEYPGSWSLDETGFEKMESGINARAIDFAKFGRLFLNNGNWNGVQVVPAAWVAEATQADKSIDYATYYPDDFIFANGQGYYQYMWWGLQRDEQNYDFVALGNHGQFIYISPANDLIILRFGESYGDFGSAEGWLELFYDFASAFQPSSDSTVINPEPFILLARNATCADRRNQLYVIDDQFVFWTSEGFCDDAGYAHVLYGKTLQEKLCYLEDSFVGPLSACEPEHNEMFETILKNLDQPDLGLGNGHSVLGISIEDQN